MLRIESGEFVLHPEPVRVADLIGSTLNRFEDQLDGHELVSTPAGELTVHADRTLISLALRQLLDNALKYSPRASKIEVGASANGTIDLIVHNSGSTIAERDRARIFDRFYRGDQARHTAGMGMGLAIVQRIAQAHGGTVHASSSAEAGTTFTLSLPKGVGGAKPPEQL
jgi:signal transduction histidine kinase